MIAIQDYIDGDGDTDFLPLTDSLERIPNKAESNKTILVDTIRRETHNDWLISNNQYKRRLPGPEHYQINDGSKVSRPSVMLYRELKLVAERFTDIQVIGGKNADSLSNQQKVELIALRNKLVKRFKSNKTYGKFIPEGTNFDYISEIPVSELFTWFKDIAEKKIKDNDKWVENSFNLLEKLEINLTDLGNLSYTQLDKLEETRMQFEDIKETLEPNESNKYFAEFIEHSSKTPLVINSMIAAHNNWRLGKPIKPIDPEVKVIENFEQFIKDSEGIQLYTKIFEEGAMGLFKADNKDTQSLTPNLTTQQTVLIKKLLNLEEEKDLTADDLMGLEDVTTSLFTFEIDKDVSAEKINKSVEAFKEKYIDQNPNINSTESFGLMLSMLNSLEKQIDRQSTPEGKEKFIQALSYIRNQISMDCNPKIVEGIVKSNTQIASEAKKQKEL